MVTAHSSSLGWTLLSWSQHECWGFWRERGQGGEGLERNKTGNSSAQTSLLTTRKPTRKAKHGYKVKAGGASRGVNKQDECKHTCTPPAVHKIHMHFFWIACRWDGLCHFYTSCFQGHLLCHHSPLASSTLESTSLTRSLRTTASFSPCRKGCRITYHITEAEDCSFTFTDLSFLPLHRSLISCRSRESRTES